MKTKYLLAFSAVAAALLLPCPAQAQCYVNYCETFAVYDPSSNAITGYFSYSDYTGTYNLSAFAYIWDPDGDFYYLGGSQSEFSAGADFSYTPDMSGAFTVMSYNYFELEEEWTFDGNSISAATAPGPAPLLSPQPDIQGVSPPGTESSPWQAGTSFYVGVWGTGFGTEPILQIQWSDGTTYTNNSVCSGPYCDTYICDWITVPADAGGAATVTVTSTGYGFGFQGGDSPLSGGYNVDVSGGCPIPTNFAQKATAALNTPAALLMQFTYSWSSSTGSLSDLAACSLTETVSFGGTVGNPSVYFPSPPFPANTVVAGGANPYSNTQNNMSGGGMTDTNGFTASAGDFQHPYSYRGVNTSQAFTYQCTCGSGTPASGTLATPGGYMDVIQNPANTGPWEYINLKGNLPPASQQYGATSSVTLYLGNQ